MQATLDAFSLKALTKALACLSKYGEELSIHATPDFLSLSATNSSKSAYSRFKYEKGFFNKFHVGDPLRRHDEHDDKVQDMPFVTGQLLTKSLLSILKHKTVEKSVDRCELSIIEGERALTNDDEDEDSLESRLVLRLHCKHGIIKTHRLVLLTSTIPMVVEVSDRSNESRLTIGPRALKDLIDHFPVSRSAKSDPHLVWTFDDSEVGLRTLESSVDSRGRGQLSTELTISVEEFEGYDIYATPITLAFHLREFSAAIAFADSMSLPLDMRFTDPATPLFINAEADSSEIMFVISTSQVHGAPTPQQHDSSNNRKRERENSSEPRRIKKPLKAVQPADLHSQHNKSATSSRFPSMRVPGSMPPPSIIPHNTPTPHMNSQNSHQTWLTHEVVSTLPDKREPLFLPSSQVTNEEALQMLGAQDLNNNDLAELLEDEGEEVDFGYMSQPAAGCNTGNVDVEMKVYNGHDHDLVIDDGDLISTQSGFYKGFQPLFED